MIGCKRIAVADPETFAGGVQCGDPLSRSVGVTSLVEWQSYYKNDDDSDG